MPNFCLFCWVKPYEAWVENTKDYLFECFWRFCCGVRSWIDYGGWHEVIIYLVFLMFLIAIKWIWEKLTNLYDKWGDKGE